MPLSLQPCMSSALPFGLEVMITTVINFVSTEPNSNVYDALTFSLELDIHLLEHLHRVRAAALLLGVEQDVALLRNLALDHVEQDGAEGLLHVRADPDEEPVVELQAGGEHSADTGASADGDTATVEMAEVGETCEPMQGSARCVEE